MTKEEELKRIIIEDRDLFQNDASYFTDKMHDLEKEFQDTFEDLYEWNKFHEIVVDLDYVNKYLTRCIEELEDEVLSGVH